MLSSSHLQIVKTLTTPTELSTVVAETKSMSPETLRQLRELAVPLFSSANPDAQSKAAAVFKTCYENNDLVGTYNYAVCVHDGRGAETNIPLAISIYSKLIKEIKELGQTATPVQITIMRTSQLALANIHRRGLLDGNADYDKALLIYAEIAKVTGSLKAEYDAVIVLVQASIDARYSEEKKQKLRKLAFIKLNTLADKHYVDAEYDLGLLYSGLDDVTRSCGIFITPDPVKAEMFFWRAAFAGNLDAFYQLGRIYAHQKDQPKVALELYSYAMQRGHSNARFEYGHNLYFGKDSTEHQIKQATQIIKECAENDDGDAQYEYAEIRMKQYLQTKNPRAFNDAIDYMAKSAKKRSPQAMVRCAEFHLKKLYGDNSSEEIANIYLQDVQQIKHESMEMQFIKSSAQALPGLVARLGSDIPLPSLKEEKKEETLERKKKKKALQKKVKKAEKKIARTTVNPDIFKEINAKDQQSSASLPLVEKTKSIPVKTKKTQLRKMKAVRARHKLIAPLPLPKIKIAEKPAAAAEEKAVSQTAPIVMDMPVGLLPTPLAPDIQYCLDKLNNKGYTAYITGGTPRNILSGIHSINDDCDMVTDAPMEEIELLFAEFKARRNDFRNDLCRFNHPETGRSFDISSDPTIKNSLQENAGKRDFTINAIYVNARHEIFDPTKFGLADLFNPQQQLRTIKPMEESFSEDPFRALRYIYFICSGFTGNYNPEVTLQFLQKLKAQINPAAGSDTLEISEACDQKAKLDNMICKLFFSGRVTEIFTELLRHDFFSIFFPELKTDADSLDWLFWRLDSVDMLINNPAQKHLVSKSGIYSILLTAMLEPGLVDLNQPIQNILSQNPFPVNFRWKKNFITEVSNWYNEKNMINFVPPEIYQSFMLANFRIYDETSFQDYSQAYSQNLPSADFAPDLMSMPPAVYQNLGQFGQAPQLPLLPGFEPNFNQSLTM